MVTYSINFGGFDRAALASEVLGSAAKILSRAGFSDAEVKELFEHASAQMLSTETVFSRIDDADDHGVVETESEPDDIWSLRERFEDQPALKGLNRLGRRASTVDDLEDAETLRKAITLLIEALSLRREAIAWLRSEAIKAGIEIAADHNEWIASATDDQLDEEDKVLFLDDYRWSGDFNWHFVGQVARALAEQGDREALASFSSLVLDDSIALEERIREEVTRSVETMGSYEGFSDYVRGYSGAGELAQAEFLDGFIRQTGFSNGTYPLERWLDLMSRRGELERYKRSNRWRVLIP